MKGLSVEGWCCKVSSRRRGWLTRDLVDCLKFSILELFLKYFSTGIGTLAGYWAPLPRLAIHRILQIHHHQILNALS